MKVKSPNSAKFYEMNKKKPGRSRAVLAEIKGVCLNELFDSLAECEEQLKALDKEHPIVWEVLEP